MQRELARTTSWQLSTTPPTQRPHLLTRSICCRSERRDPKQQHPANNPRRYEDGDLFRVCSREKAKASPWWSSRICFGKEELQLCEIVHYIEEKTQRNRTQHENITSNCTNKR
mmetsp:Transcript_67217/g.136876  ORF Transcript_67217/g.136876 Transcript_67217/m.136876 type:complete len:113 (+) Transcript_67217:2752-3090(+)